MLIVTKKLIDSEIDYVANTLQIVEVRTHFPDEEPRTFTFTDNVMFARLGRINPDDATKLDLIHITHKDWASRPLTFQCDLPGVGKVIAASLMNPAEVIWNLHKGNPKVQNIKRKYNNLLVQLGMSPTFNPNAGSLDNLLLGLRLGSIAAHEGALGSSQVYKDGNIAYFSHPQVIYELLQQVIDLWYGTVYLFPEFEESVLVELIANIPINTANDAASTAMSDWLPTVGIVKLDTVNTH